MFDKNKAEEIQNKIIDLVAELALNPGERLCWASMTNKRITVKVADGFGNVFIKRIELTEK